MNRRWIAPATSVLLLVGASSLSKPQVVNATRTPSSVALQALTCLGKSDPKGIRLLLSDREVAQTGLGYSAVTAILKGPYSRATQGFQPEGPPKIEDLDVDQVAVERSYRTPDGRHHSLVFVVTGDGKVIRLTPLSTQLFVALGNSEQAPGENHFTAWRRMLKKNRAFFESVGWKGILSDTSSEKYRNWADLDQFFASEELKLKS